MTAQVFQVAVEHLPRVSIVTLSGDIDASSEAQLVSAYASVTGEDAAALVLDFSAVNYINSAGIAQLISVIARARMAGRQIIVTGLSDHYRRIFEVTRIAEFVTIEADREKALAIARSHND
jgi:anti-sigma B factor antagonist